MDYCVAVGIGIPGISLRGLNHLCGLRQLLATRWCGSISLLIPKTTQSPHLLKAHWFLCLRFWCPIPPVHRQIGTGKGGEKSPKKALQGARKGNTLPYSLLPLTFLRKHTLCFCIIYPFHMACCSPSDQGSPREAEILESAPQKSRILAIESAPGG